MIVHSIACLFATGNAPGCARQTGHVRVFGSSSAPTAQPQNIFLRVFSWTWISRPMTASHWLNVDSSERRSRSPTQTDIRAKPACPDNGIASDASVQPLRDEVERERSFERVAGAEKAVLGELRPDQLQPDGKPFRKAAGDREPRHAGHV